jgi:hypothetical protein
MKGRSLLALGLIFLGGAASAAAPLQLSRIDQIVVHKSARTIGLYARGSLVYTVNGIPLGSAPEGTSIFSGR